MIMLNRKQVSRSSYSRTPTWVFLMQRERLQDYAGEMVLVSGQECR